jgi:hypothetical protein
VIQTRREGQSRNNYRSEYALKSCFLEAFFFQWLFQPTQGPGLLFNSVIIFFTDGRTPWTSDQPAARPLPKHRTTQTQNKRIHTANIHTLSGIRTHDPSIRASEDSSYLRPRGYCDSGSRLRIENRGCRLHY